MTAPRATRRARPPKVAPAPTTRSKGRKHGSGLSNEILRFQKPEIRLHWAIAAPFLVCYVSAVVLMVFYTDSPLRPYRSVFAWVHRIAGVCLFVFPAAVLLTHRESWRLHLHNVKQGWVWALDDLRWLALMGLATIRRNITLPHQGKFNAGEKMNFMMVMIACPLFVATGVLIWLPGIAFYAWLVHVFMATVATPLMLGHIFMALINPSTRVGLRGMISGYVDRTWARHHYHRWYLEHFGEDEDEIEDDGQDQPARQIQSSEATAHLHGTRRREPTRRPPRSDGGPSGARVDAESSRVPAVVSAPVTGRRCSTPDAVELVARARRHHERNPEEAIALLEAASSSSPVVLHALYLMKAEGGTTQAALGCGREALTSCLKSGHAELAAELLSALWRHVDRLQLTREEVHSSAAAALRAGNLALAARVSRYALRLDPTDSVAVQQLLSIAQIARDRKSPRIAMKIYDSLLEDADTPLKKLLHRHLRNTRLEALSIEQEHRAPSGAQGRVKTR